MIKVAVYLQVIMLCLAIFSHLTFADEQSWKYKDWEVKRNVESVRYFTKGKVDYINRFGFFKRGGSCDNDLLWLALKSNEDRIGDLKGVEATIQLNIGHESFKIKSSIVSIYNFTSSSLKLISFSNVSLSEKIITLLKNENSVEVQIISPISLVQKLDIKNEKFSLNGYTATSLKAKVFCESNNLSLGQQKETHQSFDQIINQFRKPDIKPYDFSPDKKFLLSVNDTGSIILHDFETKTISILSQDVDYSCGSIGCRDGQQRALFTKDGKYAVTTASFRGGPTIIWETSNWKKLALDYDKFYGGYFRVSPDSKYIAVVGFSWKDGPHLFLIDLWSLKIKEISEMKLPKKIIQDFNLEESDWFDNITQGKAIVLYNFSFSDDSKTLIIQKNFREYIFYDFINQSFSYFSTGEKKNRKNRFDPLKERILHEISTEGITETSEEVFYCCGFDSKSKEILIPYRLVEEFKRALADDDKELVSDFIEYPTKVDIDGKEAVLYEANDLINIYDKLFTKEYKNGILQSSFGCVGCKGIMIGAGDIWFDYDGKIIGINN